MTANGYHGFEGSDVIFGHLRSIASVLVNYAVKENAEAEMNLLLPCIESLMQVLGMISTHFGGKKDDFFRALNESRTENTDETLKQLSSNCRDKLTQVQDSIGDEANEDSETDVFKTIGGYFKLLDNLLGLVDNDAETITDIYGWIKRYCEKCETTSADIYKPATELFFKLALRSKTYFNLFKDLALKVRAEVGNLNETCQVNAFFC